MANNEQRMSAEKEAREKSIDDALRAATIAKRGPLTFDERAAVLHAAVTKFREDGRES